MKRLLSYVKANGKVLLAAFVTLFIIVMVANSMFRLAVEKYQFSTMDWVAVLGISAVITSLWFLANRFIFPVRPEPEDFRDHARLDKGDNQ